VQVRLRAGDGGLERVRVTGGKGKDNPYVRSRLDLETAVPGQGDLFATGYSQLATSEAIRKHGRERVALLHESLTGDLVAEREGAPPETAQGLTIHRDRSVYLGTGRRGRASAGDGSTPALPRGSGARS
jgi:hypothetical protein